MAITFNKLGSYGRKGNQLWQAAAVIALALQNNDDYIFPNCDLKGTTNIPLNKFTDHKNIRYQHTYKEPHFHYSPIPYQPNLNICESYLQSYKYFIDFEHQIKQLLRPNVIVPKYNDYTSVHVRRTDYLTFPDHHPVLTMDYYEKAMQEVNSKKFLIFSDDINWCKQHFIGNSFEFVEGNSPHVDMALQAACLNNIIANSSFSYWAGILNENSDKIVIAPKKWFGPALSMHNTKDLYYPGWLVI